MWDIPFLYIFKTTIRSLTDLYFLPYKFYFSKMYFWRYCALCELSLCSYFVTLEIFIIDFKRVTEFESQCGIYLIKNWKR